MKDLAFANIPCIFSTLSTFKAQDLTRLPKDVFGEILEMHPLLTPKFNNITLRRAVRDYTNIRAKHFLVSKYGYISQWDVSNVTDMSWMFGGAEAFNESLNNWNVSKVTDMYGMFANARAFNQPLNKWDVSNVTNMQEMFREAVSFNKDLDRVIAEGSNGPAPVQNFTVDDYPKFNNLRLKPYKHYFEGLELDDPRIKVLCTNDNFSESLSTYAKDELSCAFLPDQVPVIHKATNDETTLSDDLRNKIYENRSEDKAIFDHFCA